MDARTEKDILFFPAKVRSKGVYVVCVLYMNRLRVTEEERGEEQA